MENWLARHGIEDKDRNEERSSSGAEESRRIAALRPGARLDLHGLTVAEAEYALGVFLEDSARMGIEKVLVITGKGNHSASGAVLAGAVRSFLEANPRAGRFGTADRADGGAGALWVVVRKLISRDR
ncbi:MAG TPA: Smr/MutS family protein [Rectinemataceae bacterium]|nr:Smr/MutS family protein [Rectinemataceae bacterium]